MFDSLLMHRIGLGALVRNYAVSTFVLHGNWKTEREEYASKTCKGSAELKWAGIGVLSRFLEDQKLLSVLPEGNETPGLLNF